MKAPLLNSAWPLFTSLITLSFCSYVSATTLQTTQIIPKEVDLFINSQASLPKYVETGYSPLGRSPVVDAVLGDPFYFPIYARTVSEKLKAVSQNSSAYELVTTAFVAGGIPISLSQQCFITTSEPVPEKFLQYFGIDNGQKIFSYWRFFQAIYGEAESALACLSNEEKLWIKNNYNAFFFGKQEASEYDFLTTDSKMPLKFFELASRVNLVKLADCARKLTMIADDLYKHAAEFACLMLDQDFIWEEQGLKLIVSGKNHFSHKENADFFIDLGGHNTFYNNAGGTEGSRAAALHIDLLGENTYIGKNFVQGCGFLGAGVLVSFSGKNSYKSDAYSQGCGFFGTGLLINFGGDNHFEINFGGQSFALFGSSVLWNGNSGNVYIAHEGMAQAASSTLGVAFLVDSKGNDSYACGIMGKGGTRAGGIGQGGSIGVRAGKWAGHPSFYGGVSFLYNSGGHNTFSTPWLGQGSAYFLSAGILVVDGPGNDLYADYDSQGQGLHLAAGLLFLRGGNNRLRGGWGSLGVAGDRSVGMLISTAGNNSYEGSDQSIGTARKPKALGVFIDLQGNNNYVFKKTSSGVVQKPQSPLEWPSALFLSLGGNNTYIKSEDDVQRGTNKDWNFQGHGLGIDKPLQTPQLENDLFAKFPFSPAVSFGFNPIDGWRGNTAYQPLTQTCDKTKFDLKGQIRNILHGDYNQRRRSYEIIDLARFSQPAIEIDLSELLAQPALAPEDQLNYALLWAIQNNKNTHVQEIRKALLQGMIKSDYSRKMAIIFVALAEGPNAGPMLLQAMQVDPSEENRATAARALAKLSTPSSLPFLLPGLRSDSEMVRFSIAKGLLDTPNSETLIYLTPLYSDTSFYVRRAAALTGISLKDKNAIPVLLETFQYSTLDTEDNYGDNIFNSLSQYVGVNFGLDKNAWIEWWEKNQNSFEFPEKKVHEQVKNR